MVRKGALRQNRADQRHGRKRMSLLCKVFRETNLPIPQKSILSPAEAAIEPDRTQMRVASGGEPCPVNTRLPEPGLSRGHERPTDTAIFEVRAHKTSENVPLRNLSHREAHRPAVDLRDGRYIIPAFDHISHGFDRHADRPQFIA